MWANLSHFEAQKTLMSAQKEHLGRYYIFLLLRWDWGACPMHELNRAIGGRNHGYLAV
jgi:hypothetical protein